MVDAEGEVVGASWHAYLPRTGVAKAASNGKRGPTEDENGRGDFEVATVQAPQGVVFDTPTKGKSAVAGIGAALGVGAPAQAQGKEGEEEEVVEKTFLQK